MHNYFCGCFDRQLSGHVGTKALPNLWGPSHGCRVDTDVRQANGNRVISDEVIRVIFYVNIGKWCFCCFSTWQSSKPSLSPKPSSSFNNTVIANTGPWFCFSQPSVGCRPGRGFIDAHSDTLAAAADMNQGLQKNNWSCWCWQSLQIKCGLHFYKWVLAVELSFMVSHMCISTCTGIDIFITAWIFHIIVFLLEFLVF